MRVNFEDSIADDGHLRFLAKSMGPEWDEDRVLGKLYWVYRETQRALFVTGTIDRVVTLCVLRFNSESECRHFLHAMATAKLSSFDGEVYCVNGNDKHVSRLAAYKESASKGGKSTQSKSSIVSEATAQAIAKAAAKPLLNTPFSLLPSPYSKDKNNTGVGDLAVPQAEPAQKKPKGRSSAEQARAKLVRDAFLGAYRERYGAECDTWGAPQNAHIYHLLTQSTAEVLAEKAALYIAWRHPEVIKAGHPFMSHKWSFSATRSELKADVLDPGRRGQAAIAVDRQKNEDLAVTVVDQAARVAAKIRGKKNGDGLGNSGPIGAGNTHGGNLQQATIGPRPTVLGGNAKLPLRSRDDSHAGGWVQETHDADTGGHFGDDVVGNSEE